MNGRTAKLVRRAAGAVSASKREAFRQWSKLSANERTTERLTLLRMMVLAHNALRRGDR